MGRSETVHAAEGAVREGAPTYLLSRERTFALLAHQRCDPEN